MILICNKTYKYVCVASGMPFGCTTVVAVFLFPAYFIEKKRKVERRENAGVRDLLTHSQLKYSPSQRRIRKKNAMVGRRKEAKDSTHVTRIIQN